MTALAQANRRSFLKAVGAGALTVGFNLPLLPGSAAFAAEGAADGRKDATSWIRVAGNGEVTCYFGMVELGQGNSTTLLQLIAEELDVPMGQMRGAQVDTTRSMNQGATVSSSSIQQAGPALRVAAASLRQEIVRRASQKLGIGSDELTTDAGFVRGRGQSVAYGDLIGDTDDRIPVVEKVRLKNPAAYTIVGKDLPRRDLAAKVAGTVTYVHQIRVPDMLHGRVVRPEGQGAYGREASVLSVDEGSIAQIPNAAVIRRGNFVGVVAPKQWDAIKAARDLKVVWDLKDTLPANRDELFSRMRADQAKDRVMLAEGDVSAVKPAVVVSDTFHGPYQAHAPFGPACALADVKAASATIDCSSQDVFSLRERVAAITGVPSAKVQVRFSEGSGCYGHSCYDDAAIAAAIMSKVAGKPVRVQFMRQDELGWDNYGPAHVGELSIGADQNGKLVSYDYAAWQHSWMFEETSETLATEKRPREYPDAVGSLFLNKFDAGGMYAIANRRLVNHLIPIHNGYLKGANLRSPMDLHYSFASEQLIDRLARDLKIDPVEIRRRNIQDPLWRAVLEMVASAANWQPKTDWTLSQDPVVRGRGVALGTHRAPKGAAVADIELNRKTGEIVVKHVYAAMYCGRAVNPDVVRNQITGMVMQGVSRVLIEEVTFSAKGVTSLDWASYPVLRFGAHPEVTALVVESNDEPLGAGEEALAAAGAAVVNAVYDAAGIQLKTYPLTPERVKAALQA